MKKGKKQSKKPKLKSNTKKKISRRTLLILVIFLIIVVIIACIFANKNKKSTGLKANDLDYVEEVQNGVQINKSSKLNEAKTVNGLTFSNIQLTTKDGMSTLLADVINNSDKKTDLKQVKVTLYDTDYNELTTVSGVIPEIEPGADAELNIAMTSDYINAYDLKIEF